MLLFPTESSPFTERTVYKPAELELMAMDELRKAGLLPRTPEPIRIEAYVTKRYNLTPDYSAPLPDGVLGLTRFGAKGPTDILVSKTLGDDLSDVGRRRTNATLAHEAGHCLLHGPLFAVSGRGGGGILERGGDSHGAGAGIDTSDPSILCREIGTDVPTYNWVESQANAMIGPLLMPQPLVASLFKIEFGMSLPTPKTGVISLSKDDAATIVRKLSEIFDVNPVAARLRIEKMGFNIPRA